MHNMATRTWLNFAIFLLCIPLCSSAQDCVGSCKCSTVSPQGQMHPERIVDCSGLSLSSVPSPITTGTTQILLNNNKIGVLDVNAFKLLPNLWKIDVSNNQLQSAPNEIFKYNSKLNEVNLGNNPLKCDCNLFGLHNISKHVSKFTATCAKPLFLAKREVKSLKLEELCVGCLGLKLSGKGTRDGEYYVQLMAKCLGYARVYCHAMNTNTPKEYITVSRGSDNHAFIYDYKQPEVSKNECERKPGGTKYSEAGRTNFTRIRLVLSSYGSTIKTDDFLFASTTSKRVPLGVAGDCFSSSQKNCRKGHFKIDLTGTGFRLKETVHWKAYGTPTNIQSTLDIDTKRHVVYGECGGYCGGCKPDGPIELELDSCPEEGVKPCMSALGMDDRSISDKQITAFSNSANHEPFNGRLNHVKTASKGGSWCATKSDSQQYLQIDLGKKMTFSGIATQGAGDAQNWVTKYKIQKSDDGSLFQDHLEFGIPVEYAGNTDNFKIVKNWFSQRFRAQYVKIIPIEWHNEICLRTELYGCDNDMVSVYVRHKTDRRCWSPNSADPCTFVDGTHLVLRPYCARDAELITFSSDNTIRHTCSGKCAYADDKELLALRDSGCDEFIKKKMLDGSYQIIHKRTKYCIKRSDVKKGELSMAPCSQSSDFFEFSQDNISPLRPKIIVNPTTYLTVNKPGLVQCKVIADPRAQIFWSKTRPWPGGQKLSKLEFLQWSNGSVYVRKTQMSYTGKYYCSAANTADFRFGTLDIKVGTPPNITNGPTSTKVNLNHTAILNCVVANSYLVNKITWYKQSMGDSTAISIDKLDQRFLLLTNMSLKIEQLEKSDEGFYTCEAKNPLGSSNETGFLKVMIPPSFFIFPKDFEVPSSSSPMLNCKGVGDPAPDITWSRKNGSTLPRSSKIYSNGSLFLRNIERVDEGIYVCAATSEAGAVYAEVNIKVYGACRIDSIPFATYIPNYIFFRVGTLLIIKCNHGYQSKDGVVTNMTCVSDGVFNKALPKCKDIDECRVDPATDENNHDVTSYHNCDKNALCINTIGSYQCECSQGYKGNGTHCTPLCPRPTTPANGQAWNPDQKYYNTGATTKLDCAKGFAIVGNPHVTCYSNGSFELLPECQDINECAVGIPDTKTGELTSACPDKNTECKNIAGSYECNCKKGFESDGRGGCKVAKKRRWKTSKAIELFLKKLQYYQVNNASTLMILESLDNETNKNSLTSGDLLAVYETLKSLLDKAKSPGSTETKKQELKTFVKVCDTILADKNEKQWKNIQEDSKGVTQVMQLIEDYTAVMADDVIAVPNENSTIILNNDNLDVKLEVRTAKSMYSGHQYPNNYQTSQVIVPGKVFQDYKTGVQIIRITGITYKSLGKLLPKRADGVKSFDIDSTTIVSTSLHPKPPMHDGKLEAPVRILLTSEKTTKADSVAKCMFWDFEKNADLGGSWSAEGCRVISSASNGTVCECDHMTSFASLAVYDKPFEFTLVVYIACGLLLLVVIILVLRHLYLYCKIKSERSIIHLNLCFAIAAGVGIFVGTLTFTKMKIVCIVIAALLHYFLMAMFCWIISKCLQMYLTLTTGKNKNKKRMKWFYIVGWLFPAVVVGISLGVFQLKGYDNSKWCWLDYNDMLMWAFAGPAAAFLFVILIFVIICSIIKARVVDSLDKTKVSVSLAMAMLLALAITGTWVAAAIYVKHNQKRLWEYVFAGSCVLQAIILLLYGILDKEIKNFSFIYQIKKIQQKEHKEKRNYYSTTDTVQYYGGANAPDGKTYTVTRPSAKESSQDLRGSSKRLSRIGSNQEVNEPDYPPPIIETPGPLEESYKRNVEKQPIPYTPSFPNSEVIQLQTFPNRRGYPEPSPKPSDRQPDGAEYPEPLAYNDRPFQDRNYRPSSPRSSEAMSAHSKLQQIPERAPLLRDHREDESLTSDNSSRHEKSPIYDGEKKPLTSDPSRRRSDRSRARLDERFKMDVDSINMRKRNLRYSSGYLIGATIDDDKQDNKDHASL